MAAAEEKNSGVQWPISEDGKVSTTAVAKRIWCACIAGMSAEEGSEKEKCEELIARINAEKDWRHKYTQYILELTTLMAGSSNAAKAQASAGLNSLYGEFTFARDGKTCNVLDAVAGKTDIPMKGIITNTVTNTAAEEVQPAKNLSVPLKVGGKYQELVADVLVKQAKAWADYGCCEESVATSIALVASLSPEELPLKNRVFCMLGGTSELCPSRPLLALGATVAAVARPGTKLDALIAYAKTTAGTLLVPQLEGKDAPGLDLITHTPEVVSWLKSIAGENKLCVGSYVYLDGAKHVVASIAMDAICATLAEQLGAERVELTQLASPATAHLWPLEALKDSENRWANRSWKARVARFEANASQSRVGVSTVSDRRVFNGTLVVQGPNYALAKTLQLWRCVLARANGQVVSANFAPPARTDSVLHASTMTALLDGMQAMEPLAVLDAPTSCSFMTALLLCDLMPTETRLNNGNPADPSLKIDHPWEMFNYNAFHGGNWRCAYHQESIGAVAFVLGSMKYETGTAGVVVKK